MDQLRSTLTCLFADFLIEYQLAQGTTNDSHEKLYAWNPTDDSIACVWIDDKTNKLHSQIYKNQNRACSPRASSLYGNLIYHNHTLFKFGGIRDDDIPRNEYAPRDEAFAFSLDESRWSHTATRIKGEWPHEQYRHKIIKYKEYALIFGGDKRDRDFHLHLWCIDLNTFESQILLHSKILAEVDWRFSYHQTAVVE